MTIRPILLAALLASACAGATDKAAPADDFADVAATLGAKTDAIGAHSMKIVGTLGWNQASAPIAYTAKPKYRVIQISASLGDHLDAWVRSGDGDAVAWLLDASFNVLATNDDASDETLDAHIVHDFGPGAGATYYLAFRDYALADATFTVEVDGGPLLKECSVDADCARVNDSCCNLGNQWDAVHAGDEAQYHALLACPAHPICPHVVIPDNQAMAECNQTTHLCEAVLPADIACGGFVRDPHACPAGWSCTEGAQPDVPGACLQE